MKTNLRTKPLTRTTEVLQQFRHIAKSKGLGTEDLWRDLNDHYLAAPDHIAIFTVMRINKDHKTPIRVSGETLLAIQEWVQKKQ